MILVDNRARCGFDGLLSPFFIAFIGLLRDLRYLILEVVVDVRLLTPEMQVGFDAFIDALDAFDFDLLMPDYRMNPFAYVFD